MVFYSASKMVLLTEFLIKNRFFTLFLPRSFESCTYTHSPLGSFIPGIFDNVQQVPVRIAIVIRVVSSLPGVSSTPRSFVCALGCFDPLCVRSPLETLESGVFIPYLVAVETVTCFTRRSTMESSVVSSLPDYTSIPTLASINPSLENVERVLSYIHISCAS